MTIYRFDVAFLKKFDSFFFVGDTLYTRWKNKIYVNCWDYEEDGEYGYYGFPWTEIQYLSGWRPFSDFWGIPSSRAETLRSDLWTVDITGKIYISTSQRRMTAQPLLIVHSEKVDWDDIDADEKKRIFAQPWKNVANTVLRWETFACSVPEKKIDPRLPEGVEKA